jgi:hypothetical protein
MTGRILILAGVFLFLGSSGPAFPADPKSMPPIPFPVAKVHFEQNATDGDVEVVFEVKGGERGLAKLTVMDPDGRTVIDFSAPDPSTLGIRQFRFESPEPRDVETLKAAYPGGVYTFAGTTASGDRLRGTATLSHRLPATTSFLKPGTGARGVSTGNLKITWTPVKNVAAFIAYIEQDELDVNITATLPGSATTFSVPDGFLLPGKKYQLGVGTVNDEGNISFIETTFTTAGKE